MKLSTYYIEMQLNCERKLPSYASQGVYRTRSIKSRTPAMGAALAKLESTQYTVSELMLRVVNKVANLVDLTDDQYIIDGCNTLVDQGNGNLVSEFFDDGRGRLYQGDVHGPIGQAGDMARALQDLADVSTDYDIDGAISAIRDEMEDMISGDLDDAIAYAREVGGAVKFVAEQVKLDKENKSVLAKKPWSFAKALLTLTKLENGERPHIGMAFGVDAKCSGPQLGALMTGDVKIAKACGMTMETAERDAYELAIDQLTGKGHAWPAGKEGRNLMKKPYMGIFYGQAAGAFAEEEAYGFQPGQFDPALKTAIEAMKVETVEGELKFVTQCKAFHAAVEASFGNMRKLRQAIKSAHYQYTEEGDLVMLTNKPTKYTMPDGVVVNMSYTNKVDINGEAIAYDSETPDVHLTGLDLDEKFNKMTFSTSEINLYEHARTGLVNMIQATDAFLARRIIANFQGDHFIAVHDCFRVNINDFLAGKLHTAIKQAYKDLLTTDIIGNYFNGVEKARQVTGGISTPLVRNSVMTARSKSGKAKIEIVMPRINDIIEGLENKPQGVNIGGAYYFAK